MAKRVPEYALAPSKALLRYVVTTLQFLDLTVRGIDTLIAMPNLAEAIANAPFNSTTEQSDQSTYEEGIRKARETASLALKESVAGFPFLHESALVGLWGALEAMVEDLVVALLLNEPDLLNGEQFTKVKISLADYELLDKDERMRYLVGELQRNLRIAQRHGVNAFEALLECVDLSGEVPEPGRKSLWELNHIRNVIVHRRSLADRALVKACPSLSLKPGERLKFSPDQVQNYAVMTSGYGMELIVRLGKKYNVSSTPEDVSVEFY